MAILQKLCYSRLHGERERERERERIALIYEQVASMYVLVQARLPWRVITDPARPNKVRP